MDAVTFKYDGAIWSGFTRWATAGNMVIVLFTEFGPSVFVNKSDITQK